MNTFKTFLAVLLILPLQLPLKAQDPQAEMEIPVLVADVVPETTVSTNAVETPSLPVPDVDSTPLPLHRPVFVNPLPPSTPTERVVAQSPTGDWMDQAGEGLEWVYETLIENRLEIGIRSRKYTMDETTKGVNNLEEGTYSGTYFGTINRIEPDGRDTVLYFQYAICPYFGIGITSDEMRWTTKDGPAPEQTDGDVLIDSSLQYVFIRYPFEVEEMQIVPFIEIGQADHDASFEPEPNWGRRNRFTVQDADNSFLSYGLELQFTPNFSINVMFRRQEFTIKGQWARADGNFVPPTEFKGDHDAWLMGVKLTF